MISELVEYNKQSVIVNTVDSLDKRISAKFQISMFPIIIVFSSSHIIIVLCQARLKRFRFEDEDEFLKVIFYIYVF